MLKSSITLYCRKVWLQLKLVSQMKSSGLLSIPDEYTQNIKISIVALQTIAEIKKNTQINPHKLSCLTLKRLAVSLLVFMVQTVNRNWFITGKGILENLFGIVWTKYSQANFISGQGTGRSAKFWKANYPLRSLWIPGLYCQCWYCPCSEAQCSWSRLHFHLSATGRGPPR